MESITKWPPQWWRYGRWFQTGPVFWGVTLVVAIPVGFAFRSGLAGTITGLVVALLAPLAVRAILAGSAHKRGLQLRDWPVVPSGYPLSLFRSVDLPPYGERDDAEH